VTDAGCMVLVNVRELNCAGPALAGRKLAVRAKMGDQQQVTKPGKAMKPVTEHKDVPAAVAQVRQSLLEQGVPAATVDRALDLEAMTSIRIAINREVHFTCATADLDSTDLELSIVELKGSGEEEDIGTTTVKLSRVKNAAGMTMTDPINISTSLGDIEALFTLMISGLKSAAAPVPDHEFQRIEEREHEIDHPK
ncbi:unnamed protein product, partial [Polarella glacialis]